MKKTKKILPFFMAGLLSMGAFSAFGQNNDKGCLQRMNDEFKDMSNLKNELNTESEKGLSKMLLPAFIPGAFLGLPGLGAAFSSIYITGVVDQIEIQQIIKTVSVLDISDKIANNTQIKSDDFYKLGVFYKLKSKLEKKFKKTIEDEDLAKIIVVENNRPMDQNIFCSTLRGGNILITKFNHKLLKKLYEAYGEVEVEISDEEILNIEKEEEGSEVLDFEEESEESSPQTKSKKLKLPNPFQKK